jgi:hypothetical protein
MVSVIAAIDLKNALADQFLRRLALARRVY